MSGAADKAYCKAYAPGPVVLGYAHLVLHCFSCILNMQHFAAYNALKHRVKLGASAFVASHRIVVNITFCFHISTEYALLRF